LRFLLFAVVVCALPAAAAAQGIPGCEDFVAGQQEILEGNRYVLRVSVELKCGTMKLYADEIEYFRDTDRVIASRNVLMSEPDHIIAADRAEFNAKTRVGVFYNARGFARLGAKPDMSVYGATNPDVQFYGERLEKTGTDTYLISNGGFTTCAQANPRWIMTSGSTKLRLDHYALLRNMVLKVKGVPALYLPVMYYPMSKDNRATGFLMPSYGSSSYRGQIWSNAFFWAINRSQDATVLHDWYSKAGQAVSGEYRYVSLGGGGNFRTEFIDLSEITFAGADGTESTIPGEKSYRLNGSLSQGLGGSWYAQGRADYSSSVRVQQIYSSDINQRSRRNRILGGSISGTMAGYRLTGTYDRNEYFAENGTSSLRGNSPRVSFSRPERTLGRLPIYTSVGTDYLHLASRSYDADHTLTAQSDIDRIDIVPVVRFPYTKLPFLALNTSLTWRNTFWSDSLSLLDDGMSVGPRIDNPISRRFFEMSADVNGPTLFRIWDAPESKYAQRFKHSIEPFFQMVHRTAISNAGQIVLFDHVDRIVGKMTQYTYGSHTRLYAKKTDGGPLSVPREIIGATIRQTYYTDVNARANDQGYRTNNTDSPSHFSPVSLVVRTAPTEQIDGTFRTDFDGRYSRFRNFGADGSWNKENVSLLAGWSQVRFQPDLLGKNVARFSHFFNSNATVRFKRNRFGVIHNFNWDVHNKTILQQRISGYYNAQCCGFTAEYQMFDLSRVAASTLVPQESRFHFSVTLAGIGNVSNIFGALGGAAPR
jgi:LPS-assembly protein